MLVLSRVDLSRYLSNVREIYCTKLESQLCQGTSSREDCSI